MKPDDDEGGNGSVGDGERTWSDPTELNRLPQKLRDLAKGLSLDCISIGMRLHAFNISLSSARAQDGCSLA